MRRVALVGLVALSACGRPEPAARDSSSEAITTQEMAEPSPARAPSIGPTAAPGVAFNYDYAFRLPDKSIAGVQEAHAAACEKLGISRCRITGLRYSVNDSDQITGMLSFKLDPTIARAFGREAIGVVERNEGMLADAEISGTDAGAAIAESDADSARVRADLTALEARIKASPAGGERESMLAQAQTLRSQLASNTTARADARASLATTPMEFNYRSGRLVGGLDLRDAVGTASSSFNAMVWFIIVALGTLLPWAVLAGLVYAAFRFLRQRFGRRRPIVEKVAVEGSPTPAAG